MQLVMFWSLHWCGRQRVCCSGSALEGLGGLGGDWPQAKWGKVRKVNSCKLTFGSLHCCFDLCVGVLILPLLRLTTGKVRKVNSCDSHFGENQPSVGIADKFNFRWKRVFRLWTTSLIIIQKKFVTLSLRRNTVPLHFFIFWGGGHLHICQYFYRYLRTTW